MAIPIWKDKHVNLGSADSIDYTIQTGNSLVLYSGRAVRRPGEAYNTIRINDICADYLSNYFPDISMEVAGSGVVEVFRVCDSDDNIIEEVEFVDDWSYIERNGDPTLSEPIDRRVSARQTLFFSRINQQDEIATLRYKSGTTSLYTLSAEEQGTLAGTCILPIYGFNGLESVTIREITYKVVDDCTRYILVYANAFGGWDTLMHSGNIQETDRYQRRTALLDGARKNHVNEVERTMSFTTGWLTDDEASRMHHLLGSTNVFLCDTFENTYTPVMVTNPDCPYKTFKNTGRNLVSYTIELSYSTNRIRR